MSANPGSSPSGRAVTPGEMAQAFHEAYESLATGFGYETRAESAVPWDDVPERNRNLMIATVRNVLIEQGLTICGCECHQGWPGCGCECTSL